MLSKGYRKKRVFLDKQMLLFFCFCFYPITRTRDARWERVMRKWRKRKLAETMGRKILKRISIRWWKVRDISKGSYLLHWHTHRLVTKTQNHSPYWLIGGVFFLSFWFQWPIMWTSKVNRFVSAVTAPIDRSTDQSLETKCFEKSRRTATRRRFDRKRKRRRAPSVVYRYTFLLCINTAKDI